jgi:hypothetical protein
MNNNDILKIVLVVLGAVALIYLFTQYSQKKSEAKEYFYEDAPMDTSGIEPSTPPEQTATTSTPPNAMERFQNGYSVEPSESLGNNEIFSPLPYQGTGEFGLSGNQYPRDCFPKDQLTPAELLPGDANSKWAQSVPSTQGELGDQNFLAAGFHVGVNTVGQTLRNANRQLRSEPPNPQVKVSPWLQTTIEADTNRRPLEIGGCD